MVVTAAERAGAPTMRTLKIQIYTRQLMERTDASLYRGRQHEVQIWEVECGEQGAAQCRVLEVMKQSQVRALDHRNTQL